MAPHKALSKAVESEMFSQPAFLALSPSHASPQPGHASPRPGHASPRPGHATTWPGHASPRPGHASPRPVHASPQPGRLTVQMADSSASLTRLLFCLPFRWASFAEGTKKLLKPRRTGKRTKTIGTGSRKTSDLPHQSHDPLMSPVVLDLCIFHIWKKECSPDFSEAPLMLFSSSFYPAQVPT